MHANEIATAQLQQKSTTKSIAAAAEQTNNTNFS